MAVIQGKRGMKQLKHDTDNPTEKKINKNKNLSLFKIQKRLILISQDKHTCTYWYKQEWFIISPQRTDGKSLLSTGIISRIHLSGDEVTAITCQEGGFVRKVSEDAATQHQTARCDEQQCSHLRVANADRFGKHIWRYCKTMSPSSRDGVKSVKILSYSNWIEELWLAQTLHEAVRVSSVFPVCLELAFMSHFQDICAASSCKHQINTWSKWFKCGAVVSEASCTIGHKPLCTKTGRTCS